AEKKALDVHFLTSSQNPEAATAANYQGFDYKR
ncbi:hypothetical protein MAXJ12_36531, partial [Mesorhizobium alhagi CCNWXJ12-2]